MAVLVDTPAIAFMISPPFFHDPVMIETPRSAGIRTLK
jgi:hypothetical protein